MADPAAPLYALLKQLSISHTETKHPAVFTVDAMMPYLKGMKGACLKNLFLKDKKKGCFLLTAMVDSKTDMKAVGKQLGNLQLRFAEDETLEKVLQVKKGSVTPWAVMNDTEGAATLVLDARLKDAELMVAHPNHNEASIEVKVADFLKFCTHVKHEPVWVELEVDAASSHAPAAAAAAPAAAPAAAKGPRGWDQADELGSAVFYRLQAAAGGGAPAEAKAEAPKAEAKAEGKAARPQSAPKAAAKSAAKEEKGKKADEKGKTKLGLDYKKDEDFSNWYTDVIRKAEMIEYYEVSGCYILRPWSFFIWEQIQSYFDKEIKKQGVQNSYFPLFVTRRALETEKDHVEGFAAEVAWVTKSGGSDLAEPIAIRPTSETIMYPAYAQWIRSHRDLPLKLNQWTSVVRWEFKDPTPFLRTREFLWQEGHTAHATFDEANSMVYHILDRYRSVYEDLLACPVIKGVKSEKEKFAGGYATTTVEGFIPATGRGIQAATSHHLGQNFSKMFNITFQDESKEEKFVWQTSWGLTTRSIGVMIMNHSDDKGLVLPPVVAPVQVVLIPIPFKDEPLEPIVAKLEELSAQLSEAGFRTKVDGGTSNTPGWKFNHWELKGVPIRLEIGPRDMKGSAVTLVRRDTAEKKAAAWATIVPDVKALLDDIQKALFKKAKANMDAGIEKITEWKQVTPALNRKHLILAPWCEDPETEDQMKQKTTEEALELLGDDPKALTGAMKSLCIPLEQDPMPAGQKCFWTGKPAKRWCLFGRSY